MKNLTVQSNQLQTTVFSSGARSGGFLGSFRRLFILLAILTLSVGNMWGWEDYYLKCDLTDWEESENDYKITHDGTTTLYMTYGLKFKFYHINWGDNRWMGAGEDFEIQEDGDNGHRFYQKGADTYYKGPTGIVTFHMVQNGDGNADYMPWVWITRVSFNMKHNWNSGDWTWKSLTDKRDGTYEIDDYYGDQTTVDFGTGGDSEKWATVTASTYGDPGAGTKCRFRLDGSDRTVHIYKLLTVTYDDNGATSGTAPSDQDIPYGDATATATNSGTLAKTGSVFYGWNTKSDGSGTHYDAGSEITITENTTLYAEWGAPWAIKGTMSNDGWSTFYQLNATGESNTYRGTITLAANKTYEFKVCDRTNGDAMYGCGGEMTYRIGFVGQTAASPALGTNSDNQQTLRILSAGAGTYTFTWNSSSHTIKVEFPEETHPNSNYVYFKNSASPAWTNITAHVWTYSSDTQTGWNTLQLLNTFSFDGTDYYYAALGQETYCIFGSGTNAPSTNTGDLTGSSNLGKYYDQASATWKDFTQTVTLNNQSATTAGTEDVAATYGQAMPNITVPAKLGYSFQGYFANEGGAGTQYYNADGTSAHVWDQTGASPTLYAHWNAVSITTAKVGNWNDPDTWSPASVPTKDHDVTIAHNVTVTNNAAHANSVNITDGKLTINPDAALVVETTVKVNNGSTTAEKLHIKAASGSANGALIWGSAGTPGEATVEFYTISGGADGSADAVNQYIGIPFTSLSSNAYTSAWILTISGTTWEKYNGDMAPWTGYNIIQRTGSDESQGGLHTLTGELVANNASVGSGTTITYDGMSNYENVYANSWVAPILIKNLTVEGGGNATIYIFNSASVNSQTDKASDDSGSGNYAPFPINQSQEAVIPSMQSFSLFNGTLATCSYDAVVRANDNEGAITNATNRAPKRIQEEDYREAIWATQDTLSLYVKAASGWGDQLRMYIHEDFSTDYENGWDGPKVEGMEQAPQMYAATEAGNMAVNCVPTLDNSVIGFHAGTAANEYTMSVNYSGEEELTLVDNKTKEERLLTDGDSFTFTTEAGDSDLRFSIVRRSPQIVTAVGNTETSAAARKIVHNGQLRIVREGKIYDATGARVK